MKNNRFWQVAMVCMAALLGCAQACGQTSANTRLLEFRHTPFPYDGPLADQDLPFLDVNLDGRRGHTSARGGLYWEDTTYSDKRVLLSLSPKFTLSQQPIILVYFHGNESLLERDLLVRQQLPEQFAHAGINAVFVAPQFAMDALDSSAGHFAEANFFAGFLAETAEQVANWKNNQRYQARLKDAPVILVAYSGGYNAAAYALERGGANQRIAGVILLDALYGQEKRFADWIRARHQQSFFFSAYTEPARAANEILQSLLFQENIAYERGVPKRLARGQVHFLALGEEVVHKDFLSRAWSEEPLADLLRRVNVQPLQKSVRKSTKDH